ncbi:hypothetical protein PVK06_022835 [Gossypium arboreum]|uniref:Protein SPIRAL1-like 3 n=7 Tax=Gossypium TaxID=3633 RepID=A0ABR0P9L8_GOSAR|nr:hypothetical protein PVK06_022835 [Gossypium arboreum]
MVLVNFLFSVYNYRFIVVYWNICFFMDKLLRSPKLENMGRGVSSGGGQSSLGYLFGSGEAPPPKPTNVTSTGTTSNEVPQKQIEVVKETVQKPTTASPSSGDAKEIPAGVPGSKTNNYFRADGQNCGNFLTERRTTKVHAAPGGGSSLDYLFGGSEK